MDFLRNQTQTIICHYQTSGYDYYHHKRSVSVSLHWIIHTEIMCMLWAKHFDALYLICVKSDRFEEIVSSLCLFLFIMFLASLFPLNFLFPRGHLFSNGMEQVILCELYFYSKAPIEIFTIALNDLFSDCWTNTLLEGVHNKNTCYSLNMLCHTFGDTISKKFPREEQTKRDKTS